MEPFGTALGLLQKHSARKFEVTIPAVSHLEDEIAARAKVARDADTGPRRGGEMGGLPLVPCGARSLGTVTLELGISGIPMVVAYRVSKPEELLKYVIKAPSIVLAIWCSARTSSPSSSSGTARRRSSPPPFAAPRRHARTASATLRLEQIDELMRIGAESPSERAARVVTELLRPQ